MIAIDIHKAIMVLARRAIGQRYFGMTFLGSLTGPARLALCLIAVAIVLPHAPLGESGRQQLAQVLVVASIALIGWL